MFARTLAHRPIAPDLAALPGFAIVALTEVEIMCARMRQIQALKEIGRLSEAREVSVGLLFDHQPVIVAHADLLARVLGVFEQCGAVRLRQRLCFAAGGPSGPLH
jgi:hypothetical protein